MSYFRRHFSIPTIEMKMINNLTFLAERKGANDLHSQKNMKTHLDKKTLNTSKAMANQSFSSRKEEMDQTSFSVSSLKPPTLSFNNSSNHETSGSELHRPVLQREKQSSKATKWAGSRVEFPLKASSWNQNTATVTLPVLINLLQQLETFILNNPNVFYDQAIYIRGYDQAKINAVAGVFTQIRTVNGPADPNFNPQGDSYGADRIELSFMMQQNALRGRRQRRWNTILQDFRDFIEIR